MFLEQIGIICYTLIHITPLDILIFYTFRRQLRWTMPRTLAGYLALLLLECACQLTTGPGYDQRLSVFFQFIYAGYDIWAVRCYLPKFLSIALLTVPIELLSYSIGSYTGQHLITPLPPDIEASFIMLLLFAAFLPPAIHYIDTRLQAVLRVQEPLAWRLLLSYELTVITLTVLIDPLNQALTLRVFASRLLLFGNNLMCIYLMEYLTRSILAREYSSTSLDSLNQLRQLEQRKYDMILTAWQNSRRLRHDLKHHFVSLHALLAQRDYTGLAAYLEKTARELHTTKD